MAIHAPRGTEDLLPAESAGWRQIENLLLSHAADYGFSEIRTPTFEAMDLFCRSVGDATDVVQKEMFEVKAQKGTEIFALKPEGTAGVVRAALENGLLNEALPLKLCYITPCFRHERPQAGRLREFHQFGCEVFGSAAPAADVELLLLIRRLLERLGLTDVSLRLNSIGCPTCRKDYHKALKDYFASRVEDLCDTCRDRLTRNPMRILDCKCPTCAEVAKDAPVVLDFLCEECADHFTAVKAGLTAHGVPFTVDTRIVRGLDYYTKTVFEFVSNAIGAQGTVFGGGRYDGLVEQLGGKPTPALGFGMGVERLLLVLKAQGLYQPVKRDCALYLGAIGQAAAEAVSLLADRLRQQNIPVAYDLMGRSVKAQMKYADKLGARFTLMLGDSELEAGQATLKNMETGEVQTVSLNDDWSALLK